MNATDNSGMIPHNRVQPVGSWVTDIFFQNPITTFFTVTEQAHDITTAVSTPATSTASNSAANFGSALGAGVGNAITWLALLGGAYLIFKSEISKR